MHVSMIRNDYFFRNLFLLPLVEAFLRFKDFLPAPPVPDLLGLKSVISSPRIPIVEIALAMCFSFFVSGSRVKYVSSYLKTRKLAPIHRNEVSKI